MSRRRWYRRTTVLARKQDSPRWAVLSLRLQRWHICTEFMWQRSELTLRAILLLLRHAVVRPAPTVIVHVRRSDLPRVARRRYAPACACPRELIILVRRDRSLYRVRKRRKVAPQLRRDSDSHELGPPFTDARRAHHA